MVFIITFCLYSIFSRILHILYAFQFANQLANRGVAKDTGFEVSIKGLAKFGIVGMVQCCRVHCCIEICYDMGCKCQGDNLLFLLCRLVVYTMLFSCFLCPIGMIKLHLCW